MAGSYSLLPLGKRVAAKLEGIVREEMDAIGGQEFLLPVVHPAEVWRTSGRYDDVEGILVKFEDRRGAISCSPSLTKRSLRCIATELKSYRDLPADVVSHPDEVPRRASPQGGFAPGP